MAADKVTAREARLLAVFRLLTPDARAAVVYLGRLYVNQQSEPSSETAMEIERVERAIREFPTTGEYPHVPVPRIRH